MSRVNAILLCLASLGSPAFAADPPWSITFPGFEDIDPAKLLRTLLAEVPVKTAAALAAKIAGRPRKEMYDLALHLTGKK